VISGIETIPLLYCRNSGWVTVTSSLTVSDPNDMFLTGASVSISGNFTPSEDVLDATTTITGISESYNPSSGILTLSGLSTISNYQILLRSIKYRNTDAVNPVPGNRIITFNS
jgi:hypothetical protein